MSLVELFFELSLQHRLVQVNKYIRPLLHKLDTSILTPFNKYGVSYYISYSELCYTTHLKLEEQIDILKEFNYIPSLMSKVYLSDFSNALSDHKESTYLLDLAVNNLTLFITSIELSTEQSFITIHSKSSSSWFRIELRVW